MAQQFLDQDGQLTRRSMMAAVAAGYALAACPSLANVIATDLVGLATGQVALTSFDGKSLPIYFARPEKGEKFPIILVVQEIFGVHEHIKDVCRRFAKLGYLAIAPELYVRQGDPSKMTDIPTILAEIVSKVPDNQVMQDLDYVVTWAKNNKGEGERIGITGFCWGGRITWLYSNHNSNVRAGVAWYGKIVGTVSENTPKHPIDIAPTLKTPVLGLYGGADQGIPNDTVEKMKAALKAAGARSEIVVYPNAPHAFHADYRPSYQAEPAKDGWQRAIAWFQKNGV